MNIRVVALLPLGYPAEPARARATPRKSLAEVVSYEHW